MNTWAVFETIILLLLYFVGLPIQYKIINVCWKEKGGKTRLIHMIYSIVVTIYFTFYLPFFIVTSEIPNLAKTGTGEWFCYLATFITVFGVTSITSNSLLVASEKYMFIVHYEKAMRYGEEKTQKLFCYIFICFPMVLAIIACLTRDFDSYGALNSCFGTSDFISQEYNNWSMGFAKFFLCDLNPEENVGFGYVLFILKQIFCVLKSAVVFVINTNLPEAILYYKTFKKMKW